MAADESNAARERAELLQAVAAQFNDEKIVIDSIVLVAELKPSAGGRKRLVHLTSTGSGTPLEAWTVIGNLCSVVGELLRR